MHILDFEKPIYELMTRIEELKSEVNSNEGDAQERIFQLESKLNDLRNQVYSNMTPWEKTQVARHPQRIGTEFFFRECCDDFISLHGDRHFKDDPSILGGFAKIRGEPFLVLGHQKGKNFNENIERNFGMPHPEGYRKAMRLMRLGEKFGLPILTLIDTPGAYPGVEAEERNQSEAIAFNLQEMSDLTVPVISVVIGEGGSGGAIALGVANKVLMLEHSIYSVISPEGCASILWSDAKKAKRAANALRYTAQFLFQSKIIDGIVPEPLGGSHKSPGETAGNMIREIKAHREELRGLSPDRLREHRYEKFRRIGEFRVSE